MTTAAVTRNAIGIACFLFCLFAVAYLGRMYPMDRVEFSTADHGLTALVALIAFTIGATYAWRWKHAEKAWISPLAFAVAVAPAGIGQLWLAIH